MQELSRRVLIYFPLGSSVVPGAQFPYSRIMASCRSLSTNRFVPVFDQSFMYYRALHLSVEFNRNCKGETWFLKFLI